MPVAVLIEILVVEIRVGLCVTQIAKTACTGKRPIVAYQL